MKMLLKYTAFVLIVFLITSMLNLDGLTKTVFSKGFFIALSFADKHLVQQSDMTWQDWATKKGWKLICKLPKYVAQSLV